eukprot:SAG31_NODE_1194_length_9448_cov_9.896887_6_plen_97_part_00
MLIVSSALQESSGFFIVQQGRVHLGANDPMEQGHVERRAGDYFGYDDLAAGRPSSVNVHGGSVGGNPNQPQSVPISPNQSPLIRINTGRQIALASG